MQLTLTLSERHYAVDLEHGHDICIPVRFDGLQVAVFGAGLATSSPMRVGEFVGSVSQGGSCNCAIHTLSPHTAGTHTECLGHITEEPFTIFEMLHQSLIPATLVTLEPVAASESTETYTPALRPADMLITAKSLRAAAGNFNADFLRALVIRTKPNAPEKTTRNYNQAGAPFFSTEAMRLLLALNIEHLLVDMPSIDRLDDDGQLSNHRVFWNVSSDRKPADSEICTRTVTELIYTPDSIPDGIFLMNLQVAPLLADASPSRPVLYPVRPA